MNKFWTNDEIDLLLGLIETKNNYEIASLLGRGEPSIRSKLNHMGIVRSEEARSKFLTNPHPQSGPLNGNWKDGRAVKQTKYSKVYKEKNPEKTKAHALVFSRLKTGTLQRQPCEVCGDLRVDAHHDDYSKPLEVRWLCRKHHIEVHKNDRE